MILPNWLDTTTRNHPHKPALTFGGQRWTFADLHLSVESASRALLAGLPDPPGRIGIISTNRPGFAIAIHAAVRLGVPFVPLNWRLSPAELAWQIEHAGITLLLADDAHAATTTAQASPKLTVIPIASLEQSLQETLPSPCAQGEGLGVRVDLDAEAALLYTSGTTGRPKAAVITYGNLWFAAVASTLHLGHRSDDVWLAAMPLFHIGGLSILLRAVIGAAPVILHDRFDPERALQAIDAGATLVSLVPTMLDRMIALRGDKPWPSQLRCILLGGAAAPARLLEDCLRLGIPVATTYGLTEATSQVTTLLPDHLNGHIGSSGLPLPLTELRIMTPAGPACTGTIGEIEIRGPTVFGGYLSPSPQRNPEDWFATGDLGYLDSVGHLHVVDRRQDLIISGGENIYPAEIERVLRSHPLVSDAAVIGLPHETWGARPVAAVVWSGKVDDAEPSLRGLCAQNLSPYKIPDRFMLVPELPRTASGKLLRHTLRDQLSAHWSALTQKAPRSRVPRQRGVGG